MLVQGLVARDRSHARNSGRRSRATPSNGKVNFLHYLWPGALADWIVALKQAEHLPLLQERFPAWAEKVEYWQVDDTPEVLGLIEQEVMDLAARLVSMWRLNCRAEKVAVSR